MERSQFFMAVDRILYKGLYRDLYERYPQAFEEPIRSWEEFCARVEACGGSGLPDAPPTPIAGLLEERDYFSSQGEINFVVNAPCCPPFLHRLEFIKIIYVFRGSCAFFYRGRKIAIRAGSFCLVAPGVEQSVFTGTEEDVALNLLIRRSTLAQEFPELLEMNEEGVLADFFWRLLYHKPGKEVLLFTGKPQPLIEESVMDLFEETMVREDKSFLLTKSIMMTILAYMMRWDEQNLSSLGETHGRQDRYPLASYLLYMKSHLGEVTLASLAAHFYLSEGYLSRYLKRETGVTFSGLLRDMRMKRAAELLIGTECSVGRVTELVGYTDQSIFFRNFKAAYGMTPVAYRKNKRRVNFSPLRKGGVL